MTRTSSFGTTGRESHDSSDFYARQVFQGIGGWSAEDTPHVEPKVVEGEWRDRLYNESSESMNVPDNSVGLAFTSPPYNVGKTYESDLLLSDYLSLIERVAREVYRVLVHGGRYVINIANLGRKPYIPLTAYFYQIHMRAGFLPMGEIVWVKGQGASGSCAWGSWRSAKAPRLRDLHEYLLVFAKGDYSRMGLTKSDWFTMSSEEFMQTTLSVWNIRPESAKKIGHPAPFPLELARRVINLYSFEGDVVLDPFMGSGTTCLAAKLLGRHYVGFDIDPSYCHLAEGRLGQMVLDSQGD